MVHTGCTHVSDGVRETKRVAGGPARDKRSTRGIRSSGADANAWIAARAGQLSRQL